MVLLSLFPFLRAKNSRTFNCLSTSPASCGILFSASIWARFRIGGKWNEFLDRNLKPRPKTIEAGEKLRVEHDVEMSLIGSPTASSSTLPTHLTSKSTGRAPLPLFTIFKMVLADQLLMAPLTLLLFLGYMGITEGADLVELQNRIQRLFWKLLLVNWQVWPIIQVINFRFMPLKLRVPFGAGCGIIWTIFLSYASA